MKGRHTLTAVSTLALLLALALTASTAGCLDVNGGDGPGDANATPTPEQKAGLKIGLNIDTSERGRIMAEATFRNTGTAPIDGLSGNVTFSRGNETIAVDRVDYDSIAPGETKRFSKFYTVETGPTYLMEFDLQTGLGPVKKTYRIET